ncbi:LysR family transcriptional regulator [Aliamphritea spongicola]|uniref:LysR family transcriptional regulator n=1 Tax=Aliamphritea spongicola TaxID=707589 RepID=UPI00196AC9C3|nr:LysR family transcriptional regulator [Aliamphritea spongicola]MBN3560733.1 LysR family transcriptional regulator [Aliamphritea spongicola]
MTHDQLKAFIAVVEHGSFRAAANAIFKTQPSVSAAVRNLESQFDLQLLDRDSYRPGLTEAGRAFYRQARQLIKQSEELEQLGHQLAHRSTPTLHISISANFSQLPKLETIRQFCLQRPDLRLTINTEHLSGVPEQLHTEISDLAIGPHTGLDERFEFTVIDQTETLTVATRGFISDADLPASGQPISQSVLRNRPHILITDSGSVAPIPHRHVIPGGQAWYVNDYHMKKTLLMAGMGWARMPRHMIEAELESGELQQLDISNYPSRLLNPIYLIRLKDRLHSPQAVKLWELLTSESS